MFCINCGAECPDQAQFCASCGQKLADTSRADPKKTENISVETQKAKSIGRIMLFGVIAIISLSIIAIVLSMMFFKKKDNSIEETQRNILPNNMFSKIADLSEINLYLTRTYGQDVLQECKYYEFFIADNHYILVETVKNVSGPESEGNEIPKYELFSYTGEYIPLFECQHLNRITATAIDSKKQNNTIYKLTFDGAYSAMYSQFDLSETFSEIYGSEYEIYISIVKENVEKIVLKSSIWNIRVLVHYQYNQDGSVRSMVVNDCSGNNLDSESDIASIIQKEDSVPLGECKGSADFIYNKDGTLAETSINSSSEKEYSEHYKFEYENGLRSRITVDDNSKEVKQIQYTRDEHGLVKTADVAWNNISRQFLVEYGENEQIKDQITLSIDSDAYPVEEISASELKFISAQDLKELNGGSTIEEGMEDVVYDAEDVLLDGTYIISATAQIRQTLIGGKNEFILSVKFNDEGTKIFQEITRNIVGQQLYVLYGHKVISAPQVQSEITSGEAVISGFQSLKEAEELAAALSKEGGK